MTKRQDLIEDVAGLLREYVDLEVPWYRMAADVVELLEARGLLRIERDAGEIAEAIAREGLPR